MASRVTALKRGVTGLAALCLGAGMMVVATPANAAIPAGRTSFPGSVPSFVTAAADAGPAADTTVEGEVYLPLRDSVGAQAFATAVSTPGNRQYGEYLSPKAWIAKYSPTQADFDAVKKYLVASGETIYATPASREYIVFRGPAATVAPAFGTTLRNYRVQGQVVSAPSSAPTLPASIASKVQGMSLGDSRVRLTRPTTVSSGSAPTAKLKTATGISAHTAGKAAPAADSTSCSDFYGEYTHSVPSIFGHTVAPTDLCGYLPSQLRQSAGINKLINAGYDGSGQTVAIVDAYASPTILQDTNDYMVAAGAPILTKFSQLKPGTFQDEEACGFPSGWQGEETLDVESAHSIAPGAAILYSGGFNCAGGIDIALSKILDSKLATIVSNSYGYGAEALVADSTITHIQDTGVQAAGEGIGLYYSTGDSGDESASTGYASPDPISSFATAVGGTSLGIDARGNNVLQTGWGDARDIFVNGVYQAPVPGPFYAGAGGGVSETIGQPAYQKGVVPKKFSTDSTGQAGRTQPDVSDLADPYTGFQFGIRPIINEETLATGPLEFSSIGGTSLASPLVAAKMALLQQVAGRTIGFANPALYMAAKASPKTFNDVLAPKPTAILYFKRPSTGADVTISLNQDTSLVTTKGYDTVTGIGTLNLPAMAAALMGR
ncbi:subtilase family serine protease [Nakamurella sp. UYEF19]|uniref:S53 family peptidase n=1 Tax=Nakamurella sp. UYEF19 TaxID=1756392 RepID=UPI00339789E8